jgi:hypothetical protein
LGDGLTVHRLYGALLEMRLHSSASSAAPLSPEETVTVTPMEVSFIASVLNALKVSREVPYDPHKEKNNSQH